MYLLLGGCAFFAVLIPLLTYLYVKDATRNADCSLKIREDRSEVYRQNPSAMRLVRASSYMSESFEPVRTIDPVYDVQLRKRIEKQKRSRFLGTAVCGALIASGFFLIQHTAVSNPCLLYTSPSPRDRG